MELMFGVLEHTKPTPVETAVLEPSDSNIKVSFMYAGQQYTDGNNMTVKCTVQCKTVFDNHVLDHHPGEITFSKVNLVQVKRSNIDYTFRTDRSYS